MQQLSACEQGRSPGNDVSLLIVPISWEEREALDSHEHSPSGRLPLGPGSPASLISGSPFEPPTGVATIDLGGLVGNTRQFYVSGLAMEECGANDEQVLAPEPIHRVSDLTKRLYEELDAFVEAHTGRRSPGFGFSARDILPVRTDALVALCSSVLKELTSLIVTAAHDPLSVHAQEHARVIKPMVQSFRVHMARAEFQGGVPEPAVPHVLEQTVVFQKILSDHLSAINRAATFGLEADDDSSVERSE